jgi:hypothetical protein
MTLRRASRRSTASRLTGLSMIAGVALSCSVQEPMGRALPANAALAIAPQFERAAQAGTPSFFGIESVHGVLTPIGGGGSYAANAPFVGDSATLEFNVTFAGATQRYTLALSATDTIGDTLFKSVSDVVASSGENAPVQPLMTWVAPDTGVRFMFLSPADTLVLSGDTLAITATGYDSREATITPLYVGWTSRDTNVATIIPTGPSSARIVGRSIESPVWIVGRVFNGVADSVSLQVALKVASVALATDTIRLVAGAFTTTSATALDALGNLLDRPITFTTLDPAIATVGVLLGAPAASSRAAIGQVAPALAQVGGVSPGVTKLVASSGGRSDTAIVIVDPAPVAFVQIVPDSVAVLPRDSVRFGVVLLSANGDTLTGRKVSWATGNAQVISIAPNGTLTGGATGRAYVTATAEGVVDSAVVNVVTTGTSIVRTAVTPKTLHLALAGGVGQLVAQGYAGDSSLVPGRYTWRVSAKLPLVAVDSLGGVTPLAIGSTWVVATEKGGTADSALVTIDDVVKLGPTAALTDATRSGGTSSVKSSGKCRAASGTAHAFPGGIGTTHTTLDSPEAQCQRPLSARSASSFAERAKPASATRIP